jgi:ABC-type multidrug transport system permease subunit
VGLLAGLIGGVVTGLLSIPLQAMTSGFQHQILERILSSNPDMPPEARDAMERWATGSALRTVGAAINVVVFTIFGMLGGLLGVAMFKKDAPPHPPGTVEVLPPE